MPGRPQSQASHLRPHAPAAAPRKHPIVRALVVIDETRLKSAAWAELHTVRKRQEKAARDLHRHEEIDRPAYDAWLTQTFPQLLTRLRELHQEVFTKGQRVEAVQAAAFFSGRSAKKIWHEQKAETARPPDDEADRKSTGGRGERDAPEDDWDDDGFFDDDDRPRSGRRGNGWDERESDHAGRHGPRPSVAARDIYRRLVQRIHPDRGGPWTAARQRLWHQIQEAWAAGDVDWLSRLEVEWEAAHDVLSPASPLSRLRCAIEEFHAARRDLERKLRAYRGSPPWRFTLNEKTRAQLHHRTALNFEHDIAFLERQLAHLDAIIASWEKPTRRRQRSSPRDFEFRFFE